MNKAVSSVDNDKSTGVDPIDPSALGFTKVAYAVDETLELLSIGRTALYAAVKRGDLKRVKFGRHCFTLPTLPRFWRGSGT